MIRLIPNGRGVLLPGPRDLAGEELGWHPARPEHAEAAGVRDSGDELGACAATDAGGEDGRVDAECLTERRSQRGRHRPIIRPLQSTGA